MNHSRAAPVPAGDGSTTDGSTTDGSTTDRGRLVTSGEANSTENSGSGSSRAVPQRAWAWLRVLGGLAILGFLVWKLGGDAFRDGLRVINGTTLLAAMGIGLLTTVLNAARWCLVARGLGISLPLRTATTGYYRALFLNAALPGGVLGDVHRAVRHGRDLNDLGLGVRAVVLERTAGQLIVIAAGVAVVVTHPALVLAPTQLAPPPVVATAAAVVLAGTLLAGLLTGLLARARVRRAGTRLGRAVRTTLRSIRHGLLARQVWPGVVLLSLAALAGYLTMFLVAARAAGVTAPTYQVLPLLMFGLLAMAVPVNIGGWGPREGACAWAFAAAGLGASQGVTVAVVYGVSAFVASLPGAAVLVARWAGHRRSAASPAVSQPAASPAVSQPAVPHPGGPQPAVPQLAGPQPVGPQPAAPSRPAGPLGTSGPPTPLGPARSPAISHPAPNLVERA